MRLEIIRRTIQALADVDLKYAERIMEIAESMAESHPRILRENEIDDLYLNLNRVTREQLHSICQGQADKEISNGLTYLPTYTASTAAQMN